MALQQPMQSLQLKVRQFFNPATVRGDLTAGLVLGIESVPDGVAQGFLASINPIYGLYGYMMGTFSGAFFTSSVYMAVQATDAMALIVASVPQTQFGRYAAESVFALAILTGIIMLVAGLLKLGSLLRFVPNCAAPAVPHRYGGRVRWIGIKRPGLCSARSRF